MSWLAIDAHLSLLETTEKRIAISEIRGRSDLVREIYYAERIHYCEIFRFEGKKLFISMGWLVERRKKLPPPEKKKRKTILRIFCRIFSAEFFREFSMCVFPGSENGKPNFADNNFMVSEKFQHKNPALPVCFNTTECRPGGYCKPVQNVPMGCPSEKDLEKQDFSWTRSSALLLTTKVSSVDGDCESIMLSNLYQYETLRISEANIIARELISL